jgi:hypothetical protein
MMTRAALPELLRRVALLVTALAVLWSAGLGSAAAFGLTDMIVQMQTHCPSDMQMGQAQTGAAPHHAMAMQMPGMQPEMIGHPAPTEKAQQSMLCCSIMMSATTGTVALAADSFSGRLLPAPGPLLSVLIGPDHIASVAQRPPNRTFRL